MSAPRRTSHAPEPFTVAEIDTTIRVVAPPRAWFEARFAAEELR
jgi:hypothetical protein